MFRGGVGHSPCELIILDASLMINSWHVHVDRYAVGNRRDVTFQIGNRP